MDMNELKERENKARQHIEAAKDLLPVFVRDNAKSVTAINCYLEASKHQYGLDRLSRVFSWLEQLAEPIECPPQFWVEMASASKYMVSETHCFVTGQLNSADHQLKRIETRLGGEDKNVKQWAEKTEQGIEETRQHFIKMAIWGVVSPMDLLRRDRKYGRMTLEQEQTYEGILHRFKLAVPNIENIELPLPLLFLEELKRYGD